MGKLGAFELNYSSDIDLIVLFDPERLRLSRPRGADGVRRAPDARPGPSARASHRGWLRVPHRSAAAPHPPGHPLALAVEDAEQYYERHGQNWERAALIKARVVAGDHHAGAGFLRALEPFLWRRHLDYAAIRDIHSIKRQINAYRGHGTIRVPGHDIKVGRGGIREIEFFVQTQQLILGGRVPEVRVPATCAALRALVATRWLEPAIADELIDAYRFLRRIEHRLQMVADKQTHACRRAPIRSSASPPSWASPTAGAERGDPRPARARREPLRRAVREQHRSRRQPGAGVHRHRRRSGDAGDARRDGLRAAAAGRGADSRLASRPRPRDPRRAGARAPDRADAAPAARARRPGRARRGLRPLRRVRQQPAGRGAAVLAVRANPRLLALVADLMGTAPRLAGHLSRHTSLFEAMLAPDFFEPLPAAGGARGRARAASRRARDLQDALDATRRWARRASSRSGCRCCSAWSTAPAAGSEPDRIAEIVIRRCCRRSRPGSPRSMARRGRRVRRARARQLGSREITIGSDLDLIFIFDADEDRALRRPRPLPVPTYYARLGQRLIRALTAPTAEGPLYEIDTRLRPSGNVGPVACSLANFERYQLNVAQTWEHQALTRARVVAGDAGSARARRRSCARR